MLIKSKTYYLYLGINPYLKNRFSFEAISILIDILLKYSNWKLNSKDIMNIKTLRAK